MIKDVDGQAMLERCGISAKAWRIVRNILWIGTILATIKLIFVDYTLDEEYQIVMAYRNLSGDHLFKEMWEPHQTSAFLCALFMGLFKMVTGTTTGIILYLRMVTTVIHGSLSYWVYRTFLKRIDKEYAFLLAMLFYNISPKNIHIPEFGNMQLWFLTIAVLALMKYYEDFEGKQWYLLIVAGISLSCEILTYPTCVVLYPFFVLYIIRKSANQKVRDGVLFTLTCAASAVVWCAFVFKNVGLEEFLGNLKNLLAFDPTHDVSGMTGVKGQTYIDNIILWTAWSLIIVVLSGLGTLLIAQKYKKANEPLTKKQKGVVFWSTSLLISQLVQGCYWLFFNGGYEYLQIHFLFVLIATVALWRNAGTLKSELGWGIIATLVAYVAVMYISDLTIYNTLPHGALGIVFCMAIIITAVEDTMQGKGKAIAVVLVVTLCIAGIGARGYTLRGGKANNTIFAIAGIMKQGPAAGILADYMSAYIYNCNYEDFGQYVQPEENVLIVANMVMAPGTTSYMFRESEISHFSIVDPTTYDEKLLTYWEKYPEKTPDVIVVDCWYGELQESSDSWIMKYIENDFGYTSVNDGRYVRFYRK